MKNSGYLQCDCGVRTEVIKENVYHVFITGQEISLSLEWNALYLEAPGSDCDQNMC